MIIGVSTIALAAARCSARNNVCGRRCSPFIAVNTSSVHKNINLYYRTASSTTCGPSAKSTAPMATGNSAVKTSPEIASRHATTSRFLSSTSDGTVAVKAGRSRKRPLPRRRPRPRNGPSLPSPIGGGETSVSPLPTKNNATALESANNTKSNNDDDEYDSSQAPSLGYPEGKPWRVLWPRPHGEPMAQNLSFLSSLSDFRKRIPTIQQLRRAWSKYRETWEDGITGIPSTDNENGGNQTTMGSVLSSPTITQQQLDDTQQQLEAVGDNATKNLNIVRKDAQDLLEQAKDTTGIRTQDDLKALASEAMKIATECIREFMGGYRKGRDSEIDKMLHQYFQEEEETDNNNTTASNGEDSKGKPDSNDIKNGKGDETTSATTGAKRRKKKRKRKRLLSF